MTKKLLQKTSQIYLIYSMVLLLLSIPFFYYITQKLYIDDADETLLLHKKEFMKVYAPFFNEKDIVLWNKYNRDIKILPYNGLKKDTLFYATYLDSISDEYEPYRELNAPVKINHQTYIYSSKINLIETEDLIQSIAFASFLILALLFAGLYFINKKLSQKIWQPFYYTLHIIEKFELDKSQNEQIIFSKTDIEEFNRLNDSIQKLIYRNMSVYQSQKEFIENAAHELQTPLAVIQAKIDNLLQKADLTKEEYQQLNTISESMSRLNKLNKNLLMLSKIDNNFFQEKQNISIQNILEKKIDFFKEQASGANITININIQSDIKVLCNPYLLDILINNLMMNAIKYNVPSGKISIDLFQNRLIISNTGKPIPLDKNKLFNRFAKLNHSEHQGSGLGLAIARKIVLMNHWDIIYSFSNDMHSFEIIF